MKKRKILSLLSMSALAILTSCSSNFIKKKEITTTVPETTTSTEKETTTKKAVTTTTEDITSTDIITTTELPKTTTVTTEKATETITTTEKKTTTTTSGTITSTAGPVSTSNSTSAVPSDYEYPDKTRLDILELNDLHGYAYESSQDPHFNLASTSSYINEIRDMAEYDNVLLVANGDMFQGTAFSNLSYGKSVINAMNQMDFDFMGIGNHEFDWGLEKILNYFDNNDANGEANFPLINGNVVYASGNSISKTSGNVLGEKELDDNILPYTIIEKSGVKVGILSYIGPLTNDINQNKLNNYCINCKSTSDTSFYTKVKNDALTLKEEGADIIIINTHNGTSDGVTKDEFDKNFAAMKDDEGNYLIDAVINGHTHTYQSGVITRDGGLDMPVVQGGSYGNAVGHITLEIDTKEKCVSKVLDEDYEMISDVNAENDKDSQVQQVLDYEYDLIRNDISEVYCVNTAYAAKAKIGVWTANIMKKYADADLAFINTGGIRSALNACNVTISELYEVNPFDNNLCYVTAKGSSIINFYNANKTYYYFDSDFSISDISSDKTYCIITIDYVYYSTYFKKYFASAKLTYEDTETYARSLMVLDCKSKKDGGMNLNVDSSASLETAGWKK